MLGREVVHAYALGEDARRERQEGGDSRVVWAGNELLVPRPAALASGYAKHAVGGHAEPRRDWCTRAGQREVRDEIARRGNPRDCAAVGSRRLASSHLGGWRAMGGGLVPATALVAAAGHERTCEQEGTASRVSRPRYRDRPPYRPAQNIQNSQH